MHTKIFMLNFLWLCDSSDCGDYSEYNNCNGYSDCGDCSDVHVLDNILSLMSCVPKWSITKNEWLLY